MAEKREQRKYDPEYKVQAVKLAKEIRGTKAASELGIPVNTLYGWMRSAKNGFVDLGQGAQTPQSAISLSPNSLLLPENASQSWKKKTGVSKKRRIFWKRPALFSLRAA